MATRSHTGRPCPKHDVMPIHGIDHLELFVGNAAQAAYYYTHAFGFTETAYRGLETGSRDRVSHVLEQGRIRLVLTGHADRRRRDRRAPQAPRRRRPRDRAQRARRRRRLRARGRPRRPRPRDPVRAGRRARHSEARLGRHLRRDAPRVRRAQRLHRRVPARATSRATRGRRPADGLLVGIDHVVGNVELGHMDEWVHYYERVFGMTEMIHFSDEAISTEYSALMSKVVTDGSGRIKFPINEPAQGKRKSQIEEYLDFYRGAGVQHIAVSTTDIVGTVDRAERARRRLPADPGVLLRRGPGADRRDRRGHRRPAATGDPRRPRRRGLPAADLLQAGRRPPDGVLRGDRAARRARIRRRQLQGAVRGARARAGAPREPVAVRDGALMRYEARGRLPAKRHVAFRENGTLLTEEVMGFEGFSGNESILYHLQTPCRVTGSASSSRSSARSGCRKRTATTCSTRAGSTPTATRSAAGGC